VFTYSYDQRFVLHQSGNNVKQLGLFDDRHGNVTGGRNGFYLCYMGAVRKFV
jgi:hypothetical protein